jgi:tetrahydromethanopterin S-methyltransferase subunit F
VAIISLIYVASLIIVIWAIVDIIRQPSYLMSRNRKLGWGLATGLGWLLLGLVGAIVAGVYFIVVRPRLRSVH